METVTVTVIWKQYTLYYWSSLYIQSCWWVYCVRMCVYVCVRVRASECSCVSFCFFDSCCFTQCFAWLLLEVVDHYIIITILCSHISILYFIIKYYYYYYYIVVCWCNWSIYSPVILLLFIIISIFYHCFYILVIE
jgi:hypothetical protein